MTEYLGNAVKSALEEEIEMNMAKRREKREREAARRAAVAEVRVKRIEMLKIMLMVICVLFILWVVFSYLNIVINNCVPNGADRIWSWNVFKMIVSK